MWFVEWGLIASNSHFDHDNRSQFAKSIYQAAPQSVDELAKNQSCDSPKFSEGAQMVPYIWDNNITGKIMLVISLDAKGPNHKQCVPLGHRYLGDTSKQYFQKDHTACEWVPFKALIGIATLALSPPRLGTNRLFSVYKETAFKYNK